MQVHGRVSASNLYGSGMSLVGVNQRHPTVLLFMISMIHLAVREMRRRPHAPAASASKVPRFLVVSSCAGLNDSGVACAVICAGLCEASACPGCTCHLVPGAHRLGCRAGEMHAVV